MSKIKFPDHEASMTITHNPHKDLYQTVAEYIKEDVDEDGRVNGMYEWASEAERDNAILTNELWLIQVYPRTPVGFYAVAASSFEVLIEICKKQ